jgi:hypothetical protein
VVEVDEAVVVVVGPVEVGDPLIGRIGGVHRMVDPHAPDRRLASVTEPTSSRVRLGPPLVHRHHGHGRP